MLLYVKYLKILLKAPMQYRISFWLFTVGQFLAPLTIFAGIYFLFARFGLSDHPYVVCNQSVFGPRF
jgi:ABC-2 type transport system permease protein